MSSSSSRLLVVLLLVVAGGLTWFLTDGFGTNVDRGTRSGPAAVPTPGAEPTASKLSSSTQIASPGSSGAERRDALVAQSTTDANEAVSAEPVTWTGHVTWPAGTPTDERGEILILASLNERAAFWDQNGEGKEREVLARVPVASDGTFSLSAPAGEERWIDLDARYGYLDRPLVLPRAKNTPVELTPHLGAWLVGTAAAPKNIEISDLASTAVTLASAGGGMDFRRMMDASRRQLKAEFDGDAQFEIRGVPESGYTLQIAGSATAPFELEGIELRAGERREISVALAPGARVAGRLLDQDGAPIADVRVRAEKEGQGRRGFGPPRSGDQTDSTRTDLNGHFELIGMQAGGFKIEAVGAPLLESTSATVSLTDGQAVDGIELEGTRGASIAGRVTWPDGTPVHRATVAPRFESDDEGDSDPGVNWRERGRLNRGFVRTDEQGQFEVAGLNPDYKYSFEASWDSRDAEEAKPGNSGDAHSMGFVKSDACTVGDGPLELVLAPSQFLVGFVQDPSGAPVTSFEVVATAKREGGGFGGFGGGNEPLRLTVDNEQGEFALFGLTKGTWTLDVIADGFTTSSEPVEIVWPDVLEQEPPVIRLVLEARVTAHVVDPFGNLVPGAEVRDLTSNWRDRMQGEGRELAKRTDAYGNVTLEGLQAGRYLLAAFADGFAPSAPVDLVLEPGNVHPEIEFVLTAGGRIEGTLQDPDGEIEDRTVMLTVGSAEGGEDNQMDRTDARGRFSFEAIPAGKVTLIAMPSGGFGGGRPSPSGMQTATAEVLENETTYVELGSPPADPITITGRVTAGGEPAEAEIMFLAAGEDFMAGMKSASTDDDGNYTIVLDGPGTYQGNAQPAGRGQRAYYRTVTVTTDTTVDFTIPSGAIAGTVLENGEPKRGVSISVVHDGPLSPGAMLGAQFQSVRSGRDGTYRITGLDEGTYRLSLSGGMGFRGGSVAHKVITGIDVEADETTTGIDFELQTAGLVEVMVTDEAGEPAASGTLFVRDSSGVVVNPISQRSRSTDGKYSVGGLMPGIFTVSFQGEARASVDSEPFEIRSDETTEVVLRISAGTELTVKIVDREGEAIDASIEIFDAQGKAFHGLFAMGIGFGPPEGGWTPGQESYGPLPPGTYTVHAVHADGRDSTRKVKLSGQATRKLTVRLR